MSNRRILPRTCHAVLLLLIIVFSCSLQKAIAKDKVAIPIFFATDRAIDNLSGSELNYSSSQLDQDVLNFGVKNIVLTGEGIPEKSSNKNE